MDTSFNPGTGANGAVDSVAVQADGKVVLGGNFTQINGVPRSRVARLNADGGLDAGFNPDTGTGGEVVSVAVQPNGKIVIAGSFSTVNGVARTNLARLNADGSLDDGFNFGISRTTGNILSVAVQPDGKIVIGGNFDIVNGRARSNLARLNTDGGLDDGFNPNAGTNIAGFVESVALQADGKIVLGGGFGTVDGVGRLRVARLNADGSLDASFNPGTGANNGVYSVAVQADGKVVLGGIFSTINGVTRNGVARLNADGAPPANPGAVSSTFDPAAGTDSTVRAVVFQPDGKAIIGGAFTSYRGVARNGVARVNADGSLDASFNPGSGADDNVNDLLLLPGGQIVVGGDFNTFNGVVRNGIVRLNADGSLDQNFDAGLEAGGLTVNNAADGSSSDPTAPRPRRMARARGTNKPGFVAGLALDANGRLILAGLFQRIRGQAAPGITRVEPARGAPDPEFRGAGAGAPDGQVRAVKVQRDGKIVLGGLFNKVGNEERKNVARLNADGSADTGFNPGPGAEGGAVNALLVQEDGAIVLGGEFLRAAGQPRTRVARVNPNGSLDAAFDPGAGADGAVRALAPAPGRGVLVGGDFKNFDGALASFFSRIKPDGKKDRDFNVGEGTNGAVAAIGVAPAGNAALVGGDFTRVANTDRNRLALVDNSAAGVSVNGDPKRGGFVVSRVGSLEALTVFYRNGGSANRGVDYEQFSGVLEFAAGQREALVAVRLLPGANRNKKVKVLLDAAPNGEYQVAKAQSKVFLSDLP